MSNLACGFTKLPITEKDKVVLIPLKEFRFKFETNNGVTPSVMIDNTSDFSPFTLPIIGYYDGLYGLTDIVEDENTKIIEETYNMTINEFLSIVMCDRSFNDSYSALFKKFAKNKTTFDLFFKDETKYFENFGFIKEADYIYKHEKLKDYLFLINYSSHTVACSKQNVVIFKNQLSLKKTLENISKHLKIELNVSEEDEVSLKKLKGLSSMIIRYDVYEKFILSKPVFTDFFKEAWKDFIDTSIRANVLKEHLKEEVEKRLALENKKMFPAQYDFLVKNAYSMITVSKLGTEFKGFDNIIIYCDSVSDKLKENFQQLLTIQSFMYKTGLTYYPNKRFIQDNYDLLHELFEYKLNCLKKEMNQ